ncbi:hypothetical protein C1H46_009450 [Malus baccata]|uniref:Uncharacterized protein n=1 Tax=Malus baccata TaxID=106549 RepID=A0A540N1U1_MALBA|nr:hypothetical protein C1H46_009450 [Malus baccata]
MGSKENNPALVRPSNFQGNQGSVSSFAANPQAVENIEHEACDAHVPMFVTHTQEEDENVEDEDPVMDIDGSGSKDPLNVVEHIDDIYAHYGKNEESVSRNFKVMYNLWGGSELSGVSGSKCRNFIRIALETKEVSVSSFAANPQAVENIEHEACDAHVPMFVTHTQEEDENVEDEDPVMDIDGSGSKDPLNVVEHIDDIYAHYGKNEELSSALEG